jgi:uncharacterized protein YggE
MPLKLALVLSAPLVLVACTPPASVNQAPPEHTITVQGTASLDLVPDEACVELTLAARDPSMTAAHATLLGNQGGLLADLRSRAALVVEQGAMSYSPEYDSDSSGHTRLARHVASVQVNVRTRDFGQIPDVIGLAAVRGLDRVNVVYYSTQVAAKKAEVRVHALEAAQQKARAMTSTMGAKLGDLVTIIEGESHTNGSTNASNYVERATVDQSSDAPAPPGAIPLTTSVTVVYGLR